MGLLDLMQHMSMERQQDCRRRRAQATNGLVALQARTNVLPCQQDDDSQGGERDIQMPNLPEDIWRHIHSLMPMRDAAQAACVSHAFLRSWRCHPNLTFSGTALGMNKKTSVDDEIARDFISKVDQILKKHSGIGVKKLMIDMGQYYTAKDSCYVNSWLLIAVTPGIEELTLRLSLMGEYNFPCSLLSNGSGESIRYLNLGACSLRPTAELSRLKSLTKVLLHSVCITGDELGCLLCNSFALEWLVLTQCDEVVCLKIPCMLQRLRHLHVFSCEYLQVIDNKAPNISRFLYSGEPIQLSLGDTLKMEYIHLSFRGAIRYACAELPYSMPNLKSADLHAFKMANTPVPRSKFLHLKKLSFNFGTTRDFDYFSLLTFIGACPSLETLILDVSQDKMEHVSIFTDPSDLRKNQGQQHHKMKRVKIIGFTSARSLVELTCHFLESMTSLEYLTLESNQSYVRCSGPAKKRRKCWSLPIDVLREAQRGVVAIRTYIEPKVPSMVKLRVVEPCRRCHPVVEL